MSIFKLFGRGGVENKNNKGDEKENKIDVSEVKEKAARADELLRIADDALKTKSSELFTSDKWVLSREETDKAIERYKNSLVEEREVALGRVTTVEEQLEISNQIISEIDNIDSFRDKILPFLYEVSEGSGEDKITRSESDAARGLSQDLDKVA